MKKYALAAVGLLSAALILAPVGQASAEEWHHEDRGGWHDEGRHEGWHHEHEWHHDRDWDHDRFATGLFGGLLGATFALAAAPPPPAPTYYAPAPVYAAPGTVVYEAPAPVYPAYGYYHYPHHPVVYYGY